MGIVYIILGRLPSETALLDRRLQRIRDDALVVALHAAHVRPEAAQDIQRAAVDEILGQHHISGIDQRLDQHVYGLAGAVAEHDVGGRDLDAAVIFQLLSDELPEGRVALGVRVYRQVTPLLVKGLPQGFEQIVQGQRLRVRICDREVVLLTLNRGGRARSGGAAGEKVCVDQVLAFSHVVTPSILLRWTYSALISSLSLARESLASPKSIDVFSL